MLPSDAQLAEWTSPAAIQAWWASPHQCFFHRPYSAELVASLRGPFVEFWPASAQGMKLRRLFDKHAANGTASVSFGATDVITSHLMGDAGFGEPTFWQR